MTNWTTACLCTADPQLFSHDLLTALGMPAAGCIFFGLAKTGTRKKINRRLNVFHNVLIYSVTTLRLSLETITPMIKQSNTAQWWCMKCRPLLYYQLCPQCEQRCLCTATFLLRQHGIFNMLSELCHFSSKYHVKSLLSFFNNRCTGRKMICPAGSRFMVTFSSGF